MVLETDMVDRIAPSVGAGVAQGSSVGDPVDAQPSPLPDLPIKIEQPEADHSNVLSRQIFYSMEGKHCNVGVGADMRPAYPGAGHMRCIENERNATRPADLMDLTVAADVAAEANETDSPGPRRDPLRNRSRVQAQGLIHVGENRHELFIENHVIGRDKC